MSVLQTRHENETWVKTTLGDAFKWSSGGTPSSGNPSFYDGGIPWAVIGDLNDGIVFETARSISELGLQSSSAKWVESDSVLLAMYGSIGRLGIAGTRLTTNQAIAFTKPTCCSGKFLFYYLLWARPMLINLGRGGTQQNISQTLIKAFPFAYPEDRAEQDRIVDEIEMQLSRVESGVTGLREAELRLKRYRAATLKGACEGRLVPTEAELARGERRDYETGAGLLDRILSERRMSWSGKGKFKEPSPPSETSGLTSSDLPEGWTWATWDQVGSSQNGRSFPSAEYLVCPHWVGHSKLETR